MYATRDGNANVTERNVLCRQIALGLAALLAAFLHPAVGEAVANATKDLQSSGTENRPLLGDQQGAQSFQFGYEIRHEGGQNYDPGTYQTEQDSWKKKFIRNKNRRRGKSKYLPSEKFYPAASVQGPNDTFGLQEHYLRDSKNGSSQESTAYSEYYPVSGEYVQENDKSESQKSVTQYQYTEADQDMSPQYSQEFTSQEILPQQQYTHQYVSQEVPPQQQYNQQYASHEVTSQQQYNPQYASHEVPSQQQYNQQYTSHEVPSQQQYNQQYTVASQEQQQQYAPSSEGPKHTKEKVVDCSHQALHEVPAPKLTGDYYGHGNHPRQNDQGNYYNQPPQHQEALYGGQGQRDGHLLQNVQIVNLDPNQLHQAGPSYQNGQTIILYENGGQGMHSIRNEAYQHARHEYMAKLGVNSDGMVEYTHRGPPTPHIEIISENSLAQHNGPYQGEGDKSHLQHIVLQIDDSKPRNQEMYIEIPVNPQEQYAIGQPHHEGGSPKHAQAQEIVIEIDPQRPGSTPSVYYEVEPKGKRVNVRHAQKTSPAAENDLEKVYVDPSKSEEAGSEEVRQVKSEGPMQQVIVVEANPQEQPREQETYVQIVPAMNQDNQHSAEITQIKEHNSENGPNIHHSNANYQSEDAPKVIYSDEDPSYYQQQQKIENSREAFGQRSPQVPYYHLEANTDRPVPEQHQVNTENHKLPIIIQIEDYKPESNFGQRVPFQNNEQHFEQRPPPNFHHIQGESAQESIPRDIPKENFEFIRAIEPIVQGPAGPNLGAGEYRHVEQQFPPQNFYINHDVGKNAEQVNNFGPMPPFIPHQDHPNNGPNQQHGFGHLEQLPLSNIYIKDEGKNDPKMNNFNPGRPEVPFHPQPEQQEMIIKPEAMKELLRQFNQGPNGNPKEQAPFQGGGMMAGFNNHHGPQFPFGDVGAQSLRHPQEIRNRPTPPPHANRPQIHEMPLKVLELQVGDEKPRRPPPPPPPQRPPQNVMFPDYFDFLNLKTRNKPNFNRNPPRPRRPQRRPHPQRDPKTASSSFHKDAFSGFPKDFPFDPMFGSSMIKDFGFGMGPHFPPHGRPMPGPPRHIKNLRKSHPRDQKKFRGPPSGPKSKNPFFLTEHGIESVSGFPLGRQKPPRPPKNFDHSLPKVFMRLHDLPKKKRNHNKPKRGYASSSRPVRARGPRRPRPYSPDDPIKKIIREVESMPYSGLDSLTIEHHYQPLSMLPSDPFGWDDLPFLPTPLLKK